MILTTEHLSHDSRQDRREDFQALLDQLGEAYLQNPDEEQILQIAPGEYYFVRPDDNHKILDWPQGVKIQGIDSPLLRMDPRGSKAPSDPPYDTAWLFGVKTPGARRQIENVRFNGSYAPADGEHAETGPVEHQALIFIEPSTTDREQPSGDVVIKHCHFEEVGGDGISLHSSSTSLHISDCSSHKCYRSAIAITGTGTRDKKVIVKNFRAEAQYIKLAPPPEKPDAPEKFFVTDSLDAESDSEDSETHLYVYDSYFGNVQFDYGLGSTAHLENVSATRFPRPTATSSFILGGRSNQVVINLQNCTAPHGLQCLALIFKLTVRGGSYQYMHIAPGISTRHPDHNSIAKISNLNITGASPFQPDGYFGGKHSITTNTYYNAPSPYPLIHVRNVKMVRPIFLHSCHLKLEYMRPFWQLLLARLFGSLAVSQPMVNIRMQREYEVVLTEKTACWEPVSKTFDQIGAYTWY